MERIVYLDNAATTFPKPKSVIDATTRAMRHQCGNPGRSSHRISLAASDIVCSCRNKIADLVRGDEERVVFTSSATHSINLAVKSTLKKDDHVLISDIEHNAVYRPIYTYANKGLITFDIFKTHKNCEDTLSEISRLTNEKTALICVCHHSNVCNIVTPIRQIGNFCAQKNIKFLVDASQSIGILPLDMEADCIDFLCAPAHKGLYGIPGLGIAVFGKKFDGDASSLNTFIEGGNGIRSLDPFMPSFLPERLEAGTLAVPAIAALESGIDFVSQKTLHAIENEETRLCELLKNHLLNHPKIQLYESEQSGSILLFNVHGLPCERLAAMLDTHGICVRAGLHCAPLAHKKIGTPPDGAVRVSFGAFNDDVSVLRLERALYKILKNELKP